MIIFCGTDNLVRNNKIVIFKYIHKTCLYNQVYEQWDISEMFSTFSSKITRIQFIYY